MVPWVSNEAEAVIALERRCTDVVLVESSCCFNVRVQPKGFEIAADTFFLYLAFCFDSKIIQFVPPGDEVCGPLVAKLPANFLVSA